VVALSINSNVLWSAKIPYVCANANNLTFLRRLRKISRVWHPLMGADTRSWGEERRQFRLRLLSVVLHEANHLARPSEHEASVLSRSVNFYREAMGSYFETARNTLSFTLDRSFSRLG